MIHVGHTSFQNKMYILNIHPGDLCSELTLDFEIVSLRKNTFSVFSAAVLSRIKCILLRTVKYSLDFK